MNIIQKVFGTHSQRELKRIEPLVEKIESLRPEMMALSDDALKDKTKEFKKRLADGETLERPLIFHAPSVKLDAEA